MDPYNSFAGFAFVLFVSAAAISVVIAISQERHPTLSRMAMGGVLAVVLLSALATKVLGLAYAVQWSIVSWVIPLGVALAPPLAWLLVKRKEALWWRLVGATFCSIVGGIAGSISVFAAACGLLGDCL